ncbi:MAG: MarR family transcriptional regulator [Clostridiales bacterium]|nr:MarR family transcriptional regulator [Clostridiales bacterium]
MDRIELIQKLLKAHTRSTTLTVSFLETPRKYDVDNALYMREVHFVLAIGTDGTPTMGELAQQLNVTQGAVTQMASRLEKKGYVTRTKASDDKRVTTVSLTEKGKNLCERHIAYDLKEYSWASQYLSKYSDEEIASFIEYENMIGHLFAARK